MTTKQLEQSWKVNFKKCPLVKEGVFDSLLAKQLFDGFFESEESNLKEGFRYFKENFDFSDTKSQVDKLLEYLHFIGICISKESIMNSVQSGRYSYEQILKRAFYIFKRLSSYDKSLDINDPYFDNLGDLLFFLRIEESEDKYNNQLTIFDELDLPDFYNKYIILPEGYENYKIVNKLFNLIENSNDSYLLSGKAGTGKSTFIHYFTQKTNKNVLLVAFTGIAAINIGGQTIHSFFKFPLKPLLPNDPDITNFGSDSESRKIIEKIDTIIIDEVSMLRADILEGIDCSLRKNGGNPKYVFGGKQLILVGDIFQLPPVIDNQDEVESELFRTVFASQYFFDSPAYSKLNPKYFEFSKIFRQTDGKFISLLNKVRDSSINTVELHELNKRYNSNPKTDTKDFVITLTTNNYLAKSENLHKLNRLPYKSSFFEALIVGEFKEDKYPTEPMLEIKRNSQIIFIKNDSENNGKRWVNGTIGKVEYVDNNKIEVKLKDGSTHTLKREVWENRKYQWDKGKKKITSKVIGTFEQFPIKLAWAITIHKSQGLTFDNVIIDLGSGTFVNGQLYTALSRCRKIEGLTLKRKIQYKDIIEDKRLLNFYKTHVKGNSICIEINDICDYIEINNCFLLRLISANYPFSTAEIVKYQDIIKWGSGVNTWYEPDEYYQSASFAKYGLCFNQNVDWSEETSLLRHFEINSYQSTGFDENSLPLPRHEEIIAQIEIFKNYNESPNVPDKFSSEAEENEFYEEVANYFERYEANLNEISESLTREFDFLTIEDFIQFTNRCLGIYALNINLYNNFIILLNQINVDLKNDILDKLLTDGNQPTATSTSH